MEFPTHRAEALAGAVVMDLVLRCQSSDGRPADVCVVDRSPFKIGRRADNDLPIPQPDISGLHAILSFSEGVWWIDDKGSTNGTFVNGERISGAFPLNLGDTVNFATKSFEIVPQVDYSEGVKNNSCPTQILEDSSVIKGHLDLVKVLEDNRTLPFYQPIIDIKTDAVLGWEAIGRAMIPEGMANTGLLFWLAKQSGLEVKLSLRFRESAQACAACRHCWPKDQGTHLFINVSPSEVKDPKFLESLTELANSDLQNYYQLVIEMPESWISDAKQMRTVVDQIHSIGMLVAYDDFGQGQSRIPELMAVPPDYLKLDRELISGIEKDRIKQGMVKAFVDACAELKVMTLGEGIETTGELKTCTDLGVQLAQGFLLGRPKPAYDLFKADRAAMPATCPFVRMNAWPV